MLCMLVLNLVCLKPTALCTLCLGLRSWPYSVGAIQDLYVLPISAGFSRQWIGQQPDPLLDLQQHKTNPAYSWTKPGVLICSTNGSCQPWTII
jgi:hypothetical protein